MIRKQHFYSCNCFYRNQKFSESNIRE